MEYERVKKQIAEMFRIARVEGALRKVADGKDDAEEVLSLVEIKSDDQSLPKDYIWPQTSQSREAMRKYQSGEINKEIHNIMQSRIHSEELSIYKKAQQDMLKPDSEGKHWVKVEPKRK